MALLKLAVYRLSMHMAPGHSVRKSPFLPSMEDMRSLTRELSHSNATGVTQGSPLDEEVADYKREGRTALLQGSCQRLQGKVSTSG